MKIFKNLIVFSLSFVIVLSSISSVGMVVTASSVYPESDHNYSNNTNYTWTYNHTDSSATSLDITFSSQTLVEKNYDYIYIYTISGSLVGKYTGNELAGKTVTVNGNGFKIKLTSDSSRNYYGFSITNISANGLGNSSGNTSYPESSHNYSAYTDYTWTYYHPDSSAEFLSITFNTSTFVERNYDYIYIYTLSNELVGKYTGNELASKTIYVEGNGFKIRLDTDGIGNYYGFKINNITSINYTVMSECDIILEKTSYVYTGNAHTPSVTVKNGEILLTKDVDYTVSYSNNTNAGTASVIITGIGFYDGSVTKTFTIQQANLLNAVLAVSSQRYTGSELTPDVTVKIEDNIISANNYTVTYTNNTKVGTATVNVIANGLNVTGSKTTTFEILTPVLPESEHPYDSYLDQTWTYKHYESADYLEVNFNSQSYVEPDTWDEDEDRIYIYTLSGSLVGKYTGSELAGKTITVKGDGFKITLKSGYQYSWDDNYGFKVDSVTGHKYVNLSKCSIKLSKTSVTYNGSKQTPSVTVKYGSKTLKKDTDYTVSYSNNTNAGTAKVTITGKGTYTGKVTKTFTIKKLSLSKVTVSKISSQGCTGKAVKPKITIKSGSKTISSSNYKVTYSNNKKIGTATVTIKAKGSNLSGSKKTTFKIAPKLSYTKKNMYKGKSFTLKLNGVSSSKVKFTSSKKSVCTVSSKGVVKGIKAGSATITAKYKGVSYKCKVKVLATSSGSKDTKYYKNHDDVPDFGALVKIEPTSTKTSTTDGDSFVYSLSDLQKVDPDKEAGSKYQKLLVKCKFKKKGTTKISGKSYYKYVSKKKIVYFGIASKNGEVKIIVKKK